jgi:predicted Zn-dependent protease
MRRTLLFLSAAALLVPATAVTAQYGVRVLDPNLVAEAQRDNAQILEEYGGPETGPRPAYVASVGQRVAGFSGVANPAAAYHFTLLNSAVENAFSVPGGYVYVTRQLMSLMDDESQLAFALGHEVGHIAAAHAQQRVRAERQAVREQMPWILIGRVFGGNLGSAVAERGLLTAELKTLRFSREQEYEADDLALKYLVAAGYDPEGGPGILAALTRNQALQARLQGVENRSLPEWASTHPLSENRRQQALAEARATGHLGMGMRNRDAFLSQLNGIYVDDDPQQGVIDGRTFTHPDLRIQFTVPVGYLMDNGARAVSISGSAGKAEFGGGRFDGSLENYIYKLIQGVAEGQRLPVPPPRRTTINGIPAAYSVVRARGASGYVDVGVVAFQWNPGTVYHVVSMTSAGTGFGPFASLINSVRKISPTEAAAIQPRIIDVVTVKPGDTIQSLGARMAYRDFKVERFVSLNGLGAGKSLQPGQKVKLIVYGRRSA